MYHANLPGRNTNRRFISQQNTFATEKPITVSIAKRRPRTKREISTNEIGEMVMQQLKGIAEVAYVRFASVYRQFKDVNSFMDELKDMLKK